MPKGQICKSLLRLFDLLGRVKNSVAHSHIQVQVSWFSFKTLVSILFFFLSKKKKHKTKNSNNNNNKKTTTILSTATL